MDISISTDLRTSSPQIFAKYSSARATIDPKKLEANIYFLKLLTKLIKVKNKHTFSLKYDFS